MWLHDLRADTSTVFGTRKLITAAEALQAYDPYGTRKLTTSGMGRAMKAAGFHPLPCGQVRTSLGKAYLWALHQDALALSAGQAGRVYDTGRKENDNAPKY